MNNERFKELRDSLDKEESRMRDLRAGIDPAQIAELENTRRMLNFWENQIKAMAWNTENEDGTMVRLAGGPHHAVLKLVGLNDADQSQFGRFPHNKAAAT